MYSLKKSKLLFFFRYEKTIGGAGPEMPRYGTILSPLIFSPVYNCPHNYVIVELSVEQHEFTRSNIISLVKPTPPTAPVPYYICYSILTAQPYHVIILLLSELQSPFQA